MTVSFLGKQSNSPIPSTWPHHLNTLYKAISFSSSPEGFLKQPVYISQLNSEAAVGTSALSDLKEVPLSDQDKLS
jgi:hypothetical protein